MHLNLRLKAKISKTSNLKEELEKVVQELSAKVYEQAQQAQQQAQGEQGSQDSTVEDADFKEVKDDEDKNNSEMS